MNEYIRLEFKKKNISKNQRGNFLKQPKQQEEENPQEVRKCTSRLWRSWIAQLDSMSQELPSCTLFIGDMTLSKFSSILRCVNTCVYPCVFLSVS